MGGEAGRDARLLFSLIRILATSNNEQQRGYSLLLGAKEGCTNPGRAVGDGEGQVASSALPANPTGALDARIPKKTCDRHRGLIGAFGSREALGARRVVIGTGLSRH